MKTCFTETIEKDLEQVTGGNFLPNRHSESEYASVGITVVTHFFANDEFWWNGEEIGHSGANAVYFYRQEKGIMPKSVAHAVRYHESVCSNGSGNRS